jgi:hypothetical protein
MLIGACLLRVTDNMVYTRGSRDNFDRWANVTEDEGLKWDNMFQYMLRVGNFSLYGSRRTLLNIMTLG